MASKRIAGIDLGTTHSLIGVVDAGFPVLIADEEGRRLIPSVVHFPENGEPVCGWQAKRLRGLHPDRTVHAAKRLIGRNAEEVEGVPGYRLVAGRRGVEIAMGDRRIEPEEVSALVLRRLVENAERALGEPLERAVITVPAYFNDAQRSATRRAGERAGLDVVRILAEPTSAALAYGLDRLRERSRVAVYDLGGGTFDLSILELREGLFEVLATHGNTRLGGEDLDEAVSREVSARLGVADSPKLREAAEAARIRLSEAESAQVLLPFAEGERSAAIDLTRDEIERICAPILEPTRKLCFRALADADLEPDQIDEVVLVGGVTRMPLVRRIVAEVFGREPNTSQHPDEAIALGAVIQAGILEGTIRNVTLLDVTPLSLGIETFGGLMNVLIPRNSTIPCKAGEMFTNAAAGQTSMRVTVLQGERELAKDNWKLGEFEIPFTPAAKGQARVGVQFEIDADGILKVLARDVATGLDTVIEVSSAVDVSGDHVETMISESVEHAFDDMQARVFAEARIKAEEMLPAVEAGLQQLGGRLTAEERDRIITLVHAVREAISSGAGYALKERVEALDVATETLAALLIEALSEGDEDSPSDRKL